MPFYRRGYYRRGRYGYGYRGYNRSWRRRGWYRRGGISRASTQGNRRFGVIIPTQAVFSFTVPANNYWSDLHAICPYSSNPSSKLQHAGLTSSLLYRTYTRLYDQVKIDWVSVKISIMSLVGAGGVAPAVKVCTSWDRDMNYHEVAASNGDPGVTVDSIQTGSESQTTLVVNNSRAIINRFNGASDIQERTVFHDCSVSLLNSTYYADDCFTSGDWGKNIGYVPGLFMALNTATSPGSGSSFVFTCSLDVKYHVTFRNPKFGLSATGGGGTSRVVGDFTTEAVQPELTRKSVALPSPPSDLQEACGRLAYNIADNYDGYVDGSCSISDDVKVAVEKLGVEGFRKMFGDTYDEFIGGDKKDGELIKEA